MFPPSHRSLLGFLLLLLLSPVLLPAIAVTPLDPTRAVSGEDDRWDVTPAWTGLGTLSPPVLNAEQPFAHDPSVVLDINVRSRKAVTIWIIGNRTDGNREVFPSRSLPGDGEEHRLLWSIDPRIGRGGDFKGFQIAVGSEEPIETADHYSVSFGAISVVSASGLTDSQILEASSYAPLILEFAAPKPGTRSMKGVFLLPSALAARHLGAKVLVLDEGETVVESVIDASQTAMRGFYLKEFEIPVRASAGERRTVELVLMGEGDSRTRLGSTSYRPVDAETARRQFEVPFQDIMSYAVFPAGPDLGIITVVRDLYARAEPAGAETMTHEMLACTVSPASGLFDIQPAWRVPAFAHWAEAGFRTVGVGHIADAVAIFVTGVDGEGLEQLGLASAAGRSPVRPAINNPVFSPAPEYTGWVPGQPSALRGNAVISYGRTFALLGLARAGDQPSRLIAALSPGLRSFADAGALDISLPVTARGLGHLDATQRGGLTYLLTDSPDEVWTASDPLRAWQSHGVKLPRDWFSFRLGRVGDGDQVFGLAEHEGRRVLRWAPVGFKGEGVALPVLLEDPSETTPEMP